MTFENVAEYKISLNQIYIFRTILQYFGVIWFFTAVQSLSLEKEALQLNCNKASFYGFHRRNN